MKTSPAGIALIEQFEGLRLKAYQDQAGVFTIGFGHTGGVQQNQYETREQAEQDLCHDVASAETAVTQLCKTALNQNQYDACVSFTYNEGSGRFKSSTLLQLINANNMMAASQQFLRWDIVAGVTNDGLLKRRTREMEMFLTPDRSPVVYR